MTKIQLIHGDKPEIVARPQRVFFYPDNWITVGRIKRTKGTVRKKTKAIKINLRELACELATMDQAAGRNQDVIGAETTLASLGRKLRTCSVLEAVAIIGAIVSRGGVK